MGRTCSTREEIIYGNFFFFQGIPTDETSWAMRALTQRVIYSWMLHKWDAWLGICSDCAILWTRWWTFCFHKARKFVTISVTISVCPLYSYWLLWQLSECGSVVNMVMNLSIPEKGHRLYSYQILETVSCVKALSPGLYAPTLHSPLHMFCVV
jgi:hypothetical protein